MRLVSAVKNDCSAAVSKIPDLTVVEVIREPLFYRKNRAG